MSLSECQKSMYQNVTHDYLKLHKISKTLSLGEFLVVELEDHQGGCEVVNY